MGEPGSPKLSDAYLAQYPHRIVPALELDDGTVIGEVPVICRYLEALYPKIPLLGTDPKEQALIAMWDRKCELEGLQAIAEVLRNKVKVFAGRALPGYTIPIEQIDGLIERGTVRMAAFYQKLDARLGESEFLALGKLTFADITGFCVVEMAKGGKMTIPDECAHVRRWYENLTCRLDTTA